VRHQQLFDAGSGLDIAVPMWLHAWPLVGDLTYL
jgi:hypothetical protein